jgi:hypothetical protein
MHGWGVSAPPAAAVAAATIGLAGEEHMPKLLMFVSGTKSAMLAAGIVASTARAGGGCVNRAPGANPNVQANEAPDVTCTGMGSFSVSPVTADHFVCGSNDLESDLPMA